MKVLVACLGHSLPATQVEPVLAICLNSPRSSFRGPQLHSWRGAAARHTRSAILSGFAIANNSGALRELLLPATSPARVLGPRP